MPIGTGRAETTLCATTPLPPFREGFWHRVLARARIGVLAQFWHSFGTALSIAPPVVFSILPLLKFLIFDKSGNGSLTGSVGLVNVFFCQPVLQPFRYLVKALAGARAGHAESSEVHAGYLVNLRFTTAFL